MRKVMTIICIAKATDLYSSLEFINFGSKGEYYSDLSKKGVTEHLHSLAQSRQGILAKVLPKSS